MSETVCSSTHQFLQANALKIVNTLIVGDANYAVGDRGDVDD